MQAVNGNCYSDLEFLYPESLLCCHCDVVLLTVPVQAVNGNYASILEPLYPESLLCRHCDVILVTIPMQAGNGSSEQSGRPCRWNSERHFCQVLPVRCGSSRGGDLAIPPLLLPGQGSVEVRTTATTAGIVNAIFVRFYHYIVDSAEAETWPFASSLTWPREC